MRRLRINFLLGLKQPIQSLSGGIKINLAERCNRFATALDPSMYSRRSGITAPLHIHALEMPATLFTLIKRRQCRCKSGSELRAVLHWPIERSRILNPLYVAFVYTLMNFVREVFFPPLRNMHIDVVMNHIFIQSINKNIYDLRFLMWIHINYL